MAEDFVFAGEIDDDTNVNSDEVDGSPWWESLSKNQSKILSREDSNKKYSMKMWNRIRMLEKADIDRINQTAKYEMFYNINGKNIQELDRKIAESSYNVIRGNCNTAQSKLGKEMPKISFLTDRANFGLRNAAKMLDQYIEAEFERSELFPSVRMAVLDACISKLGIVKILFDKKNGRFKASRVRPLDFLVDDNNSMYTQKNETFERKKVSTSYLMKMFPNMPQWQKEIILEEGKGGRVSCFEAFYKDKIRVWFTSKTILKITSWEGKPPYFYWRWTQSTMSFWGVGIADELVTIQRRINYVMLMIAQSIGLFAIPRVLLNTHDNITGSQLTNELGSVIKVSTAGEGLAKVNFLTPPILNDQYFQHLEDLYMKAYQITGISQLSSTGQKPKGLNSGRALLAYHDIQTDRFAQASQNLVDMYIDIARYMATLADKHFTGKEGKLLPYKIEWKKLDIKNNIYQIKQYPTNLLSKSPAGRLEDVQMLINMGIIPPEKAIQLLEFPDISKAVDMLSATDQAVESLLERIVEGEKDISPDPNLPMGRQIETAQKFYGRAFVEGADDKTLEDLESFIVEAKETVKKEIQEQQMAQAGANDMAQQGQDIQAPAGPLAPQMPGNLPMQPEGQKATMPMNQGGMR